MLKEKRNINLDCVRGIAAIAVFLGHLRALLYPNYHSIAEPSLIQSGFYFLTSLGHESVVVFFVLSGYFVGGSLLATSQTLNLKKYLISRLSRLWIVLLPALLLTFFIDIFIKHNAPNILQGQYYHEWNSGPKADGNYSATWATLIGNIFFLQTILCPVFGTNSPLWSLSNEFWYYILFPIFSLGIGWVKTAKSHRVHIPWLISFVVLIGFLPVAILKGFVPWSMGVAVYLLSKKISKAKGGMLRLFGVFSFMMALFFSKSVVIKTILPIPYDWVVALSFSILCMGMIAGGSCCMDSRPARIISFISESSYSLYANHFPLLILSAALGLHQLRFVSETKRAQGYIVLGILIWGISIFMWYMFERNTDKVRNYILKAFSPCIDYRPKE
jgi:peptidoglycan/LPS O-acetylase OafA/YrhL